MQPLSSAVSHGKELYNTNSPSATPVTIIRIVRIRVRVPHVAAPTIWGRGLVKEIRYHHHYGVCETFVVAAAATVYQEPHFYRGEGQEHFALLFDQIIFIAVWSNLTQEIQFLEFIGGSNSTHAHLNYLICMCFTTVFHAVTSMTNCLYHFQLCLILALLNSICI